MASDIPFTPIEEIEKKIKQEHFNDTSSSSTSSSWMSSIKNLLSRILMGLGAIFIVIIAVITILITKFSYKLSFSNKEILSRNSISTPSSLDPLSVLNEL